MLLLYDVRINAISTYGENQSHTVKHKRAKKYISSLNLQLFQLLLFLYIHSLGEPLSIKFFPFLVAGVFFSRLTVAVVIISVHITLDRNSLKHKLCIRNWCDIIYFFKLRHVTDFCRWVTY